MGQRPERRGERAAGDEPVSIPRVRNAQLAPRIDPRRNPTAKIERIAVALHPSAVASVADGHWGERIGSLADAADVIVVVREGLLTRAPLARQRGEGISSARNESPLQAIGRSTAQRHAQARSAGCRSAPGGGELNVE